jgi:glutamyl-tRNA reductase
MNRYLNTELSNFFVAGIKYKKTDTEIRGSFAIELEQYVRLLNISLQQEVRDLLFYLHNRTEIYGITESAEQLMNLLCTETKGTVDTFRALSYQRNGVDAVRHLFDVGAGLDSQILGDYEIVGQLRKAMKFAKERGFIHSFLDRTLNQVLQSSKEIKNNTSLSDGTVSVAFAAVQYIGKNPDS